MADGEYYIAKDLQMKRTGTCDISQLFADPALAGAKDAFRHPVLDELAKGLTKAAPGPEQEKSIAAFYGKLFDNLGDLDERIFTEAEKALTQGAGDAAATAAATTTANIQQTPAPMVSGRTDTAPKAPKDDGVRIVRGNGADDDSSSSSSDDDNTPFWSSGAGHVGGAAAAPAPGQGAEDIDLSGMMRFESMEAAQAAMAKGTVNDGNGAAGPASSPADAAAAAAHAAPASDTVPQGFANVTVEGKVFDDFSDIREGGVDGARQLACAAFEASTNLLSERTIDRPEGRAAVNDVAQRYMAMPQGEGADGTGDELDTSAARDPKEVWEEMERAWDDELAAIEQPVAAGGGVGDSDDEFDAPPIYKQLDPDQQALLEKLRAKFSQGLDEDDEYATVGGITPASHTAFQAAASGGAGRTAPTTNTAAAPAEPCPTPNAAGLSDVPPQFAHLQAAHDKEIAGKAGGAHPPPSSTAAAGVSSGALPPEFEHLQALQDAHDAEAAQATGTTTAAKAASNATGAKATAVPAGPLDISELPPEFAHLQALQDMHDAEAAQAKAKAKAKAAPAQPSVPVLKPKHLSSTPAAHRQVNDPDAARAGGLDFAFSPGPGQQKIIEGPAAHAMQEELAKLQEILKGRGPEAPAERVADLAARLSKASTEKERVLNAPVRPKKKPLL